jgi:hypothetical protein
MFNVTADVCERCAGERIQIGTGNSVYVDLGDQ